MVKEAYEPVARDASRYSLCATYGVANPDRRSQPRARIKSGVDFARLMQCYCIASLWALGVVAPPLPSVSVMSTLLPQAASPPTALPPDLSFYELSPSGPDYLDRMSSLIARIVPGYGTVTEMGSPVGELCRALQDRSVPTGVRVDAGAFDMVLTREDDLVGLDPRRHLSRCLVPARRAVVWVVPADDGTRLLGPTLTGCLPRAWIEELESRPLSVETLYATLARDCPPNIVTSTAWTMPLVIRDLGAFTATLTHRMGWSGSEREADLHRHLAGIASDHPFGHAIPVSRRSAVLAWMLQ